MYQKRILLYLSLGYRDTHIFPPFWIRFGVNNIIYIIDFQNQILIIQFFLLYQLIKIHIIKHKENFTIGLLIFVLTKASTTIFLGVNILLIS